jgi:hypothetical protein
MDVLDDAELEAIADRAEQAAPAPWVSSVEGRDFMSGDSFIATGAVDVSADSEISLTGATAADQDFIAVARADVPRLVAEIRRLRRSLSR